jgi:cytochrome c peroxidase
MHFGPAPNRTIRYTSILTVIASVGFGNPTFSAAIVGKTRSVDISGVVVPSIDETKANYQRPTEIPFPENNPYTLRKALLGQKLFFDRRLSGSSAQSCASCHDPGFAWSDGLPLGVGNGMTKLDRRSPSIINVAWGAIYMWDGRAGSLEQQALGPIQSVTEMNMPIERLLDRLNSNPEYTTLFSTAFPSKGISERALVEALATYERTIVSAQAPFDDWIAGNEHAVSEQAKRGFAIFNGKGHCASCHEGWNFTNDSFQDIGIPDADLGRGRLLPQILKMNHAFKTPGLREVFNRSPYMHDGSIQSLEDVVEHYDRGGVARPSRSDLIVPLRLAVQDKLDLVAFLKTLSSNMAPTNVPVFPR